MTCTTLKPQLALAAGGDLAGDELLTVERHCEQCPACAEELKALRTTLQALTDAGPAAIARVDLAAIYQDEARRQARSARRWRRAALGLSAAATLLLGLFGLSRLELRWDAQQLVVRWGDRPDAREKSSPAFVGIAAPNVKALDDAESRLARLEELVLALDEDAHGLDTQLSRQQRRDRQTAEVLVQLAKQLDDLRQETRRDRAGLYAALNAQATPSKE